MNTPAVDCGLGLLVDTVLVPSHFTKLHGSQRRPRGEGYVTNWSTVTAETGEKKTIQRDEGMKGWRNERMRRSVPLSRGRESRTITWLRFPTLVPWQQHRVSLATLQDIFERRIQWFKFGGGNIQVFVHTHIYTHTICVYTSMYKVLKLSITLYTTENLCKYR